MAGLMALDLANKAGWATLARPDARPNYGTHKIGIEGSSLGDFIFAYDEWLNDMITVHKPNCIYYECPIIASRPNIHSALKLIGIAAHTEFVAKKRKILRIHRPVVSTIKKSFTGNGHAKKHHIMNMCKTFGWVPEDDNTADALAVLHYAAIREGVPGWDVLGIPETCKGEGKPGDGRHKL